MKKESKEATNDYLIFARKFRPESFDDVAGQEPVTQILKNAIKTGRIPQSFLFTGPRGVGKTSTARILAKALNCAKGPSETPCNQCEICREISRSVSLDVLEIDGASNRGIEEIRVLRDNVKFKPAQSYFKIYIIDEVHMLTGEAFNALLKTLEEPPEHVKFIFATTEPHKVPLTILSRCQRFNFKRISTETIVQKLSEIAKAEGLKPDPQALFLMARASDGSLRDGETLLDQLSVLSQGEIREEDVLLALGLASDEVYFKLLEALQKKEPAKIFSLTQELYESGKDLVQFGKGLYELLRNLLLFEIGKGAETFVEMNLESKKRLAEFKGIFSREELLLALSLFQNLQGDLRRSLAPPRLLLETALLKLLHLEGLRSVKELLENQAAGTPAPLIPINKKKPESRSGVTAPLPQSSEMNTAPSISSPSDLAPKTPSSAIAFSDVERIWSQLIEAVKAKEMSTGMFLAEAAPVEVNGDVIVLGFPEEFRFHKEMLDRPEKRKSIEEFFLPFLKTRPQIQFVTTRLAESEKPSEGPSEERAAPSKLPEIVLQAMDIFKGSKIVRAE